MTRAAAKYPSQDRRAHEVQVKIYRNSIVAIYNIPDAATPVDISWND
jgi:hypothetical protein